MASRWLPAAVISTFVFLPWWAADVAAQSRTNSGSTNSGSTNSGSTNAGSTNAGGTNASGQTGQMDIAGQITVNERFLRENRDPGQLVGGAAQGVGNLRGQTDAGGQGNSGMFGNQGGFNSMNQFGNSFMNSQTFNAMSRQRQQLRVPLRLGPNGLSFSSTTPAVATGANLRVQNHLARIPQLKSSGSVQVEMEGQVAVLRGAVASQHERDLVARLVLLEPGIADVRNELQVASALPVPPPVKP
jgi:osmotically-inducible protein OsmY